MPNEKIFAKVLRFDPSTDKKPYYVTYEVPWREKLSLLEVLRYIYENYDTVAFRYGCRSGMCGTCGVTVNGKPVLACETFPDPGEITIEPLMGFKVIRDLVIDRDQVTERSLEVQPWLLRLESPIEGFERIPSDKLTEFFEVAVCRECYLCFSACPVLQLEQANFAGPKIFNRDVALRFFDPRDGAKNTRLRKIRDELWFCANCNSCNNSCPCEIPLLEGINELRSQVVETGFVPGTLRDALTSTYKYGNPWGGGKSKRIQWTEDLEVKKLSEEKAEILYHVGCTPSYDTRAQEVARSIVTVFEKAGVDFGILGNEERCCGNPILRIGEKGLFELLAEENIKTFDKYGVKKIVTTCPHGYNTFTRDYPKYGGKFEVQHYTQFISDLIDQNKLVIQGKVDKLVTYHDPCFLGKHNNVYEAPRKILKIIPGLTLVEMPRNRENSFCCGGGGGRMWIEDVAEERLCVERAREAASINPDVLVTACPLCLINLEDGIKVIGKDEEIQVMDIMELLKDAGVKGKH